MEENSENSLCETPLLARASASAGVVSGNKIIGMYMPAGVHTQSFWQNGKPVEKTVNVTRAAATELQNQLLALNSTPNKRVFFDFDHEGNRASAWPERFFWQDSPEPGVYHESELSASGKAAIEGKDYRTFSPVFHYKGKGIPTSPATIACNPNASHNMGGFVNDPAFEKISPIWARNSANNSGDQHAENTTMKQEDIDALKAGNTKLQGEIDALKGKATRDAVEESSLKAKQAEKEANDAKLENAELKAKNKSQADALHARNVTDAKAAVAAAVAIGAIAAQDTETIAAWEKDITENPARAALLAKMPGNPALGGRVAGSVIIVNEGPANTLKAYGALAARNAAIKGLDPVAFHERGKIGREMGAFYAANIRGKGEMFDCPLSAASSADTLGTLSGTLVAQRTLEFFRIQYPMFSRIYLDFSDQPAVYGQAIKSRIVSKPSVQTYSSTLGADGRPAGWSTASAAVTTDTSTTLDEHVGVPIPIDGNTLGSTVRNLFAETAPAASYALAKYFVAKIYALMTAANFNGYAAVVAGKVPVAYATFPVGLADMARSKISKINTIFNPNEVPITDRTMLLNSDYHGQLANDPSLVTFFAGFNKPGIITDNDLPNMSKFTPVEAPDLPTTGNLVGFALQKSALIAVTRLPNDYSTALPGASNGSVTTITDPDTGMSVMLTQFVDHVGGYAEWRISVMLGASVGDKRAGLCITSQ